MACGRHVPKKTSDVLRRNAGTKHNEPKRTSREAARCVSVHSVSHPSSADSHLTSGDFTVCHDTKRQLLGRDLAGWGSLYH